MINIATIFLLFNIPNCVQIESNRYLDKNEVTNKAYFWFVLDSDENERGALYPSAIFKDVYGVDFKDLSPDNEIMKKPVIGLSKEQCLAFCHWRSEKIMAKNADIKLVFELPTYADYKLAETMRNINANKSEIFGYRSRFIGKNSKKFKGLNDNVSELMDNGSIYKGKSDVVGFRCVAVMK